jgi:hypothetical protein
VVDAAEGSASAARFLVIQPDDADTVQVGGYMEDYDTKAALGGHYA